MVSRALLVAAATERRESRRRKHGLVDRQAPVLLEQPT
jgi:hypothetical protein